MINSPGGGPPRFRQTIVRVDATAKSWMHAKSDQSPPSIAVLRKQFRQRVLVTEGNATDELCIGRIIHHNHVARVRQVKDEIAGLWALSQTQRAPECTRASASFAHFSRNAGMDSWRNVLLGRKKAPATFLLAVCCPSGRVC